MQFLSLSRSDFCFWSIFVDCLPNYVNKLVIHSRGGVEDTTFEAEAKDTKKSAAKAKHRLLDQILLRPRKGMLEAKDQGRRAQVFSQNNKIQ